MAGTKEVRRKEGRREREGGWKRGRRQEEWEGRKKEDRKEKWKTDRST
jgi:hypothetical protein